MHTQAVDDSQQEIAMLWATGSIRPEQEFHQHLIPWKHCSCTCGPSGSTVSSSPSQLSSSMRRFSTTRCQMNQPHLQRRVRSRRWRVFHALCTSGASWTRWSQPGFAQTFVFFVHLALFVICFIQLYIGHHRPSQNSSADITVWFSWRDFTVVLHCAWPRPIWLRNPDVVNQSEYTEFYKTTFKATGGRHLAWCLVGIWSFNVWVMAVMKLSNQSSHWYLILIWSTPGLRRANDCHPLQGGRCGSFCAWPGAAFWEQLFFKNDIQNHPCVRHPQNLSRVIFCCWILL